MKSEFSIRSDRLTRSGGPSQPSRILADLVAATVSAVTTLFVSLADFMIVLVAIVSLLGVSRLIP